MNVFWVLNSHSHVMYILFSNFKKIVFNVFIMIFLIIMFI